MSGIITFVDSRTVLCYFIDPNFIAGGFDQYNSEPLYWELDSITVNHCTGNWELDSITVNHCTGNWELDSITVNHCTGNWTV